MLSRSANFVIGRSIHRLAVGIVHVKLAGMLTRHCHNCGWEYTLPGLPGRTEACHQCGADLKICLNCTSYDPRVAHQCRDRRAEPVAEKNMANFCEWFDFIRREWKSKGEENRGETAARENLKKLFGD